MKFDLEENNKKAEELWAVVEVLDARNPEYTIALRAYFDEATAARQRTLDEMSRVEAGAEDE